VSKTLKHFDFEPPIVRAGDYKYAYDSSASGITEQVVGQFTFVTISFTPRL
jgi:hypothetical protein